MALQDDVRNLASLPAFRDFDPEALRLVAFSAETRILRAGDALFRRGDASDGGFVVLSGAIAMEAAAGGPAVVVRAPALIGESSLVAETVRAATAFAREPSSVLKVPRSLYRRILGEYPASAVRVRRAAARRLLAMRGELEGLRRTLTG